MGWTDNLEEVEKLDDADRAKKLDFDTSMRSHIAELKEKIIPMLDCCPTHKTTAEFAIVMLDQCEKVFTSEGKHKFAEEITSMIAGVANILAFLLHLVPHNNDRRRFMEEVIKVVETSIPGFDPDSDQSDEVSIKEIEIAPGVKVNAISVSGDGDDIAKQVADVISKIVSGEMPNPNGTNFGGISSPPKSKLH